MSFCDVLTSTSHVGLSNTFAVPCVGPQFDVDVSTDSADFVVVRKYLEVNAGYLKKRD
jgi:hypothetical protein